MKQIEKPTNPPEEASYDEAPQESTHVIVSSHLLIRDKSTGQVLINVRGS
jgi:hypothetical protein